MTNNVWIRKTSKTKFFDKGTIFFLVCLCIGSIGLEVFGAPFGTASMFIGLFSIFSLCHYFSLIIYDFKFRYINLDYFVLDSVKFLVNLFVVFVCISPLYFVYGVEPNVTTIKIRNNGFGDNLHLNINTTIVEEGSNKKYRFAFPLKYLEYATNDYSGSEIKVEYVHYKNKNIILNIN